MSADEIRVGIGDVLLDCPELHSTVVRTCDKHPIRRSTIPCKGGDVSQRIWRLYAMHEDGGSGFPHIYVTDLYSHVRSDHCIAYYRGHTTASAKHKLIVSSTKYTRKRRERSRGFGIVRLNEGNVGSIWVLSSEIPQLRICLGNVNEAVILVQIDSKPTLSS